MLVAINRYLAEEVLLGRCDALIVPQSSEGSVLRQDKAARWVEQLKAYLTQRHLYAIGQNNALNVLSCLLHVLHLIYVVTS